ncbi:GINS complex subunit [Yamadazyma tenuis]|uniref:GINS complex subunit n=1 Tax=Candida tenuis TaxID=2315449 RepID=UPI0027A584A3|nr:GINS complex subunit [Yamadazyma tenuis]
MEVDDILRNFDTEVGQRSQKPKVDLYTSLSRVMLNERMAPEILPYQKDLLDEVLSRITNQQQLLLDSHEYGDVNIDSGIITSDYKLQLMIMETDIERLIRLSKLETFTIHYIRLTGERDDTKATLLSDEEQEYLTKYMGLLQSLYNNSILKKIPRELTYLDEVESDISMVTTPDVDEMVFIKVLRDETITIPLEDEDELQLEKDAVFVVKYGLISGYLNIGDVILI